MPGLGDSPFGLEAEARAGRPAGKVPPVWDPVYAAIKPASLLCRLFRSSAVKFHCTNVIIVGLPHWKTPENFHYYLKTRQRSPWNQAERKGAAGVLLKQIPEGAESSAERERKYDRRYSVFKEPEVFRVTYRFNC
jgi:hypothetical protein